MTTKRLITISLFTATLCVLAPLSIPLIGGVPISLATFMIMLIGSLTDGIDGLIIVGLYIFFGLIGLPVYASFSSGASVLFGMTGGFIFGYFFLVYITKIVFEKNNSNVEKFVGLLMANAVLYCVGIIYFMWFTKLSLKASLLVCVFPFIPGDLIKIVIILLIYPRLKRLFDLKNK